MANFRDRSGGGDRRGGGRGFGGGGRSFDRRDGGGRRDFGGRSDRPQMFTAICDNCGKECQVPFKPTNGKPVFCDDCFRNRDNDRGGDFQRPERRFEDRVNDRDRDFDRSESRPNREGKDINIKVLEQMSSLNNKLDRILSILGSKEIRKSSPKVEKTEKDEKAALIDEASKIADLVVEEKPKKAKKVAAKKTKAKK